ncbi:dihydrofolate reductase family protein [Qaidamihabitans albus]|uniref:dihydrofolate reductase family protein n=1 Tax=Qaidamihabitans albus TaxID=2795733 RepID=UPI001F2691BE|nr:dihydrofolate reductase family protein [Qaidamihabitans albus]
MATLIYSMIASLDGYVEDESGDFGWAVPDEEVHTFINELERPIGTYLYGRRMYEMMAGWETDEAVAGRSPVAKDFARIWQATEKIVYSSTWRRLPPPGPGSNGTSTPKRSGGGKRPPSGRHGVRARPGR